MTHANDRKGTPGAPALPWPAFVALGAVLLGGTIFYFIVTQADSVGAAKWGVRGDSIAPFAGLLSAGALFAALWAVHLQRRESHESADDTRKQLEKMSQQVVEFARAADAQVALAESQKELAKAQVVANEQKSTELTLRREAIHVQKGLVRAQDEANLLAKSRAFLALRAEHAQRCGSIATLAAGLATTRAAIETAAVSGMNGPEVGNRLKREVAMLEARWKMEHEELAVVTKMITEAENKKSADAEARQRL